MADVKGIEHLRLKRLGKSVQHLVRKCTGDPCASVGLRYTVGKNMFRLLYKYTWQGG